MNILWTIALVIMLTVAYAWGYDNGQNSRIDADRAIELEKYKFDKFYEHERWLEERKVKHDLPDA